MSVKANLAKVCAGGFGVALMFLAPVSCPGAGSTVTWLSGNVGPMAQLEAVASGAAAPAKEQTLRLR